MLATGGSIDTVTGRILRPGGPYQLLKSGKIDLNARTITLPLYQGKMRDGRKIWYVLTDTTDAGNAAALGLNYAAKLNYAAVGRAYAMPRLRRTLALPFRVGQSTSPQRGVLYRGTHQMSSRLRLQNLAQSAIRTTLL